MSPITGWRYELEYQGKRGGCFNWNSIIGSHPNYDVLAGRLQLAQEHHRWLTAPKIWDEGRYFFTALGKIKAFQYLKEIRKLCAEFGMTLHVLTTRNQCLGQVYQDEYQFILPLLLHQEWTEVYSLKRR